MQLTCSYKCINNVLMFTLNIEYWYLKWFGDKKGKIYFNNKPAIASRLIQRLIDSVTKLSCAAQRHKTVLLWLCLELFLLLKKIQQKQELLCLKCKSLNINFLFIELFIKSMLHLQSCWYLEKNVTLRAILTTISDDINICHTETFLPLLFFCGNSKSILID